MILKVLHYNYKIHSPSKRRIQAEPHRRPASQQGLRRVVQLPAGPGAPRNMALLLPPHGRDRLCGAVARQRWEVPALHLFELKVSW